MTKIIFVHGWGFDGSIWDNVICELNDIETVCLDLGFFGQEQTSFNDKDAIFITHSMGLAWVLKNVKPSYKGLVSINGFTKFCQAEDWPEGVPQRMLSRMIRQFDKNPETVWSDFMIKSGLDNPVYPPYTNLATLSKGLKDLGEWDVREEFSALSCPKLICCAKGDMIVSEKLSDDSFGKGVEWYESANHLLPLQQAPSIAAHIRSFVEKLT